MEISWTKPTEALANWDDAKIKAANFNSGAFECSIQCNHELGVQGDILHYNYKGSMDHPPDNL